MFSHDNALWRNIEDLSNFLVDDLAVTKQRATVVAFDRIMNDRLVRIVNGRKSMAGCTWLLAGLANFAFFVASLLTGRLLVRGI